LIACGSSDDSTTPASQTPDASSASPTPISGSCDTDPLKTGIVAQQTGESADAFDCEILKWTAKYSEPDPMLFKAMIYGESRFDQTSVGCPNNPCGTPDGWTSDETGCFGLMQVVPACGSLPDNAGLLTNGHPNLTKDQKAADWAGSIFNPDINVHVGIAGFSGNRKEVEGLYPGCTVDQYTMMAMGNYASHGSTKGCTTYNTDYADYVLPAYRDYAKAAGYTAHAY
jgi:hypothetical protein